MESRNGHGRPRDLNGGALLYSCAALLATGIWKERIRRKAKRLKLRLHFRRVDIDDVEQELRIGVWQRLGDHQMTAETLEAYFNRALKHSAVSLIRQIEGKRKAFNNSMQSLDAPVHDGAQACVLLHETVTTRSPGDIDLELDVHDLLEDAPERVKALAMGLKETSRAGYARQRGMARGSTYRDLKAARLSLDALRPDGAVL